MLLYWPQYEQKYPDTPKSATETFRRLKIKSYYRVGYEKQDAWKFELAFPKPNLDAKQYDRREQGTQAIVS